MTMLCVGLALLVVGFALVIASVTYLAHSPHWRRWCPPGVECVVEGGMKPARLNPSRPQRWCRPLPSASPIVTDKVSGTR